MTFQTPITIKEIISGVHKKDYLLPAIQREFVWEPEQIIRLFDSLMRGYPIGSFLFWQVEKNKIKDFQFYEFIRSYHERDNTHNPPASISGNENFVTAILDGQQRLTALYIGLKGDYSYKVPRRRWENDDAFPKRKLYLNLLSKSKEFGLLYDFDFLTPEEASQKDENHFWFEVGKIFEFNELIDIFNYLRDQELITNKFASDCLCGLFQIIIQKNIVNYYLETSQELDKVLNIFIRVNSGGTTLSYSDLLLSVATAKWKTKDAREEINSFVDDLNKIGDGFDFDKDFVLKSCLVLTDITEIAFKVDNFNQINMENIELKWDNIKKALRIAVELVDSFGYNHQTLTSTNAIIPIAYYILKKDNPENFVQSAKYFEDRESIKKWFTSSLLKKAFSGQPDGVLRPIRTIIMENSEKFPVTTIIERFKGTNKSLTFTEEDIDSLIELKYGGDVTFTVLALLYPTLDFRNKFHEDHIHPKSFFKKSELKEKEIDEDKYGFYLNNFNFLPNLQLLEGLPNEEKSNKDFKEWFENKFNTEQEKKDYMAKHYIPNDISLDFTNFENFYSARKELLKKGLKIILGVK
jgi:uncharacterized protein with ParB-like and HNH nuclease domain